LSVKPVNGRRDIPAVFRLSFCLLLVQARSSYPGRALPHDARERPKASHGEPWELQRDLSAERPAGRRRREGDREPLLWTGPIPFFGRPAGARHVPAFESKRIRSALMTRC